MTILRLGNIVRTNYNTGPYVITCVTGPCQCPEYVRSLDGDETPSEEHFHITCQIPDQPERGNYWLNGHRDDGTSVWGDDKLYVVDSAAQQELFA